MEETLDQTDSIREQAQNRSQTLPGPTPAPLPVIPGYRMEELLGTGSFGQVWAARQTRTGLEVAVKIFTRPAGLDWDYLRQEVSRLGRVAEHPNVVSLIDAGLEQTPPFFVMRRYGGSLSAWRQAHSPPPVAPILEWWEQIAQALAYTHGKGLLHCDLKPSNVLLDAENRAMLCDFGQSVARGGGGTHFGSLGYMAPEQAGQLEEGFGTPDVRWDIYALGATLYYLFTGHVPRLSKDTLVEIGSLAGTAEKLSRYRLELAQRPLEPVRRTYPQLHPELAHLLEACLALNPAQRPQNAQEILEDLRRYRHTQPLLARRPWSPRYRLDRFVRRNAVPVALTAVIAAISSYGLARHWSEQNVLQAQADFDRGLRDQQDGRAGSSLHWWLRCLQVNSGHTAARWQIASSSRWNLEFFTSLKEPLNAVGFSPDGNLLYASSESGSQVFDLRTGAAHGPRLGNGTRPNHEIRPVYQNNPPASVLLPGARLLTLSERTQIWNLSSGEAENLTLPASTVAHASEDGAYLLLRQPQGLQLWHAGRLVSVATPTRPRQSALSRDGKLIAYGDDSGTVWLLPNGGPPRRLGSLGAAVELLEIAPDGQQIVACSEQPGATLWELPSGQMRRFASRSWGLFGLTFSPDGLQLAGSSYDGYTYLWNPRDEKVAPVTVRHRWLTYGTTFSPDGKLFATYSLDGCARVWESATGQPVTPYLEHSSPVKSVAFRPGPGIVGALDLATACEDGTIRLFRLDLQDRPAALGPGMRGFQGGYNADGTRLVAACEGVDGKSGAVALFDTSESGRAPRLSRRIPLPSPCRAVAWRNPTEIVCGCLDGSVLLLSESGQTRLRLAAFSGPVNDLEVSPDGSLLVAVSEEGVGRLYDLKTGREQALLKPDSAGPAEQGPMLEVEWNAQGSQFATTSGNHADVWDASGKPIRRFSHQGDVRGIDFSPDGKRLATSSLDKTARVWDLNTGQPLTPPMPHELACVHVSFDPSGNLLATSSADGMARVWDARTGRAALSALRHRGPVWNTCFSPDGSMLATCSKTGEARLYNLRGQQLMAPIEHSDFAYTVCFRPDGRALATISWDGNVQQRDLSPPADVSLGELQRRVQKRTGLKLVTEMGRCLTQPLSVEEWTRL